MLTKMCKLGGLKRGLRGGLFEIAGLRHFLPSTDCFSIFCFVFCAIFGGLLGALLGILRLSWEASGPKNLEKLKVF